MSQLIFCGVVRFTICLQNFMCFVAQTNFQHLEKFRQNGHHLTTGNNTTIFWKSILVKCIFLNHVILAIHICPSTFFYISSYLVLDWITTMLEYCILWICIYIFPIPLTWNWHKSIESFIQYHRPTSIQMLAFKFFVIVRILVHDCTR